MEFAAIECGSVFEFALLGGSVIFGWIISTLLLSAAERRAGLHKKAQACLPTGACGARELSVEEAHTEFDDTQCLDEPEPAEQPLGSAKALFEAYGLFGAAPGTWSPLPAPGLSNIDDLQAEPDDDELADNEDEPASGHDAFVAEPNLFAHDTVASLWEQYEIFGTAAGKWSVASSSTTVSEDEMESELSSDCDSDVVWDEPLTMAKQPPDGSALAELWEHYGLFAAEPCAWS